MSINQPIRRSLPWAALAAALVLPAALALRDAVGERRTQDSAARLSDYGRVPDFELTDRNGRAVRSSDLRGTPWLAGFVFTRCPDVCPTISSNMARLHERLPDDVRLVSLSVDPEHDTPAVLAEYARRFRASGRWLFLTGGRDEMRTLVSGGFHLSAVEAETGVITHSDRIALVDSSLRIRRYYRGTEPGWVDEAIQDLEALGGP